MPLSYRWRKSRRSGSEGDCVEGRLAPNGDGVQVRDSKDPDGPALAFSRQSWSELLAAFRDGELHQ